MASATQHQPHEAGHPTPAAYVRIALILTVVTAVEVAIFYLEGLRGILVPALLLLSAGKFSLVVGYYMHLKFDNRLFSTLFVGGLLLAIAVALALIALFDNYQVPAA